MGAMLYTSSYSACWSVPLGNKSHRHNQLCLLEREPRNPLPLIHRSKWRTSIISLKVMTLDQCTPNGSQTRLYETRLSSSLVEALTSGAANIWEYNLTAEVKPLPPIFHQAPSV